MQVAIIDEAPAKRTDEPQQAVAITEPETADAPAAQANPAAPVQLAAISPYQIFRQVPAPYQVTT